MGKRLYSAILIAGISIAPLFAGLASAEKNSNANSAKSDVLAKVNGVDITKDDVNEFIKLNQPVSINLSYDKLKPENRKQIVNGLIDKELMVEAAKKGGIENSDEYKKELESAKKALLVKHWLKKQLDNIIISDGEAKKFYEKVKMSPEVVHARHILLKSEADAKKIISELSKLKGDALKKKFIELAKKKSIGPSAKSGGDLGYFRKEQMVLPFATAAFSTKKGTITKKPVKTQFGWHIIYVQDHKKPEVIPFEKLKDKIVQDLKQQQFKDKIEKDLKAMRKKASIEILDKSISKAPAKQEATSKK